jgi:hypothetical protein
MTTWNHRLFQEPDTDGEPWLTIREVHYDDAGEPALYTTDAMEPCGNTVESVRTDLERMLKCLDKPILTEADFKGNTDDI